MATKQQNWWSEDAPASEQPQQNWWGEDVPTDPTAMQKIEAVGQGATGGMLRAAPIAAGAVAGGMAGTAVLPGWGTGIGAVGGAIAGIPAGEELERRAAQFQPGGIRFAKTLEETPQELRPYRAAGETLGASVPFAVLPFLRPMVQGKATTPIEKMVQYAQEAPKRFLTAEATGAAGAGVAGGVAEAYRPGEQTTRWLAEIAGGTLLPSRVAMTGAGAITNLGRRLVMPWYKGTQESEAARVIQKLLADNAEDATAVANDLMREGVEGIKYTAATKARSPTLVALENEARNESRQFGLDVQRQAEESLNLLNGMIARIEAKGDPASLAKAAQIRKAKIDMLLDTRIAKAEKLAEGTARAIGPKGDVGSGTSKAAERYLDEALKATRAEESKLWNAIPQDTIVGPNHFLNEYETIAGKLLPEEVGGIDPVITGVVKRLREGGATVAGEMLRIRTRMLARARNASAAGKFDEANQYGRLASAALDDLSSIPGQVRGLDEARDFSRSLHDTFSRTFAGDALSKEASGARRIPPEVVLRRAMSGGREGAALRFKEMREAVEFLPGKGLGGPESQARVQGMLDLQEQILRSAASEALDPNTGRVSLRRLATFARNNKELLQQFPEVRKTVNEALASEEKLQNLSKIVKGRKAKVEAMPFAKIAGVENPSQLVDRYMTGPNAERDMRQLVRVARGQGKEAVNGLVSAVMDNIMSRAKTFEALENEMLFKRRGGGQSKLSLLVSSGAMKPEDAARLNKIISEGAKIEKVMRGGAGVDQLVKLPQGLMSIIGRIAGAKAGVMIGKAMPGEGGGHSLIAASRGSQYVRDVLDRIPTEGVRKIIFEAAKNPELMAALLQKDVKPQQGMRIARQINAYLIQAGLIQDSQEAE